MRKIHIIKNTYAPNNRTPKYLKQKLTKMKGEIDNSTIIARNVNTQFSIIDRMTRQKINKEIEGLKNTINQLKLKISMEHLIQQQ